MRNLLIRLTNVFPSTGTYNLSLLLFRIAISIELILAHGLKKVGVGDSAAEQVPNPLNLPDVINLGFTIASNLVFPVFVIVGLFIRLAIIPILAVTLSGYFQVHWNDSLLEKDMPFIYSVAYLLFFFRSW